MKISNSVPIWFNFSIFPGLTKRAILTDINFDEMNPDAVKGGATKKEDEEVVSDTDLKWFDPDSPLTPNSVDKLIEAVNSLNDVFGTFISNVGSIILIVLFRQVC